MYVLSHITTVVKNTVAFSQHTASKKSMLYPGQSGQALLIILLVLAVSLTVVLSTASKSVTDIQTTGLESDSLRAFNAAEVGIEEALIQQAEPVAEIFDNEASYSVTYTVDSPDSNEFIHPAKFFSGDTATFWFVSQDGNGNFTCDGQPCLISTQLNVCWGNSVQPTDQNQRPAIEVSVYYDTVPGSATNASSPNFSNVRVARRVFDPVASRRTSNNFLAPSGNCIAGNALGPENRTFPFRAQINFNSDLRIRPQCLNNVGCLLKARVKFLYNVSTDQPIGIRAVVIANTSLPPQGAEIDSTGFSGDSTRRINVYQTYGEVPSVFDSAVFSKGSLIK